MEQTERRILDFEIRAENNEQHGDHLTGLPIVFGQRTNIGWYDEIVEAGALDNADLKDVRFFVGHDTTRIPLARSRNNNEHSTMQMSVGERGMEVRIDLDTARNSEAKNLYSAVKRGDISGMSFMFSVDKDTWDDPDSEHPTRHINAIKRVFEVSAVAFPAYEGTSLEARSEGEAPDGARASLESARAELRAKEAERAKNERRAAAIARLDALRGEVK